MFLTLNEKLEMIKLSDEGMLEAKIGQKLGLLSLTAKLSKTKEKFLKGVGKCYPNKHLNVKKLK